MVIMVQNHALPPARTGPLRRLAIGLWVFWVVSALPLYAVYSGEPRYPGDKRQDAGIVIWLWMMLPVADLVFMLMARRRGERRPSDSRLVAWWPAALLVPWLWIPVVIVAIRRGRGRDEHSTAHP